MDAMKITVLLVDDQPAIASAHQTLPEDYPEIGTVLVAHGEEDYWQIYEKNKDSIDVIVMDLMLDTAIPIAVRSTIPVRYSGFTLMEETLEKDPEAKFVVFTQYLHETNVLHAYRTGAKCFISKHQPSLDSFVDVIVAVAKGEIVVPEEYSLTLKNKIAAKQDAKLSSLSDEELSIVEMLINGYETDEIREATNSASSASTNNKISKILKATAAPGRSALILYAMNAGMLSKKMNS